MRGTAKTWLGGALLLAAVAGVAVHWWRGAEEAKRLAAEEAGLLQQVRDQEKAGGPDHWKVAALLARLGMHYRQAGAPKQAEEAYLRALAVATNAEPGFPGVLSETHYHLGRLYRSQGALEKAAQHFAEGVARARRHGLSQHLSLQEPLLDLADLYAALGRHAEAEALYLDALKVVDARTMKPHPSPRAVEGLAKVYRATGQMEAPDVVAGRR